MTNVDSTRVPSSSRLVILVIIFISQESKLFISGKIQGNGGLLVSWIGILVSWNCMLKIGNYYNNLFSVSTYIHIFTA